MFLDEVFKQVFGRRVLVSGVKIIWSLNAIYKKGKFAFASDGFGVLEILTVVKHSPIENQFVVTINFHY